MNKNSVNAVLERLMEVFKVNNDTELAKALGVNRQTLASWRRRESVPYSLCIKIAEQYSVSLDWLLSGRENVGGLSRPSYDCNSCPQSMDDLNPMTHKWLEMFVSLDEEGQKNILQDIEKEQQQTELRQQLKGLQEDIKRLKNAV
ncbi:bacteriophage CI repressor [Salmonella enterica subsp. enterica serovar Saintpaul]|nr:bacteriophage CI repressor [Salmonella enterica subsp. enterica serovar Saintpaul]EDU2095182.1 bacteriophage CI repressor [Salmonella enterica subsp. enterica serovar Saintpaul]EDW0700723.1 bacteriophage CI repressor [Salmonella enterica subsp. enterica]EDX7740888.1 bacteriophage CI repressor [Salmonella enterica subsp. enterica serovar Saintpaul]EIW2893299.1 helix-turn-helix domain-containing protein [Salmonella enterica]